MDNSKYLPVLLSHGYFPKELPPVFTTTDFGANAHDILADWKHRNVFKTEEVVYGRGKDKKKLFSSYTYKMEDTEYETLSKPKRGYERRELHIVHPLPQALLAYEIASNWRTISKWVSRQIFTLDRIEISSRGQRAIKEINFKIHLPIRSIKIPKT